MKDPRKHTESWGMHPTDRTPWDNNVRRKALDRERRRLVKDQERRMKGDRRSQHIKNAILNRARKVVK